MITQAENELLAKQEAWNRFQAALDNLDEQRAAFVVSPCDSTVAEVRNAEVELDDAIAVAGEFQVHDLPWELE